MRKIIILLALIVITISVYFLSKSNNQDSVKDTSLGKKLYANCQPCHPLFKDGTGPSMYGTLERIPNKDWLYKFIKNPAMIVSTDAYAKCLKVKYKSLMTGFLVSDKEIDAIYDYVYTEAKKNKEVWKNPKFFIRCK